MIIGRIMERTPKVIAAENMANRLADRLRNFWLSNKADGQKRWEENFFEDPDGIRFLESESFPGLRGIDYIFKWWGNNNDDSVPAGELEVLWKVDVKGEMVIFKTSIRFIDRDFTLSFRREEEQKREDFRRSIREAFALWQELYLRAIAE